MKEVIEKLLLILIVGGCFLGFTLGMFLLIGAWNDRSIDYVASELKNKQTDCPYYASCLATFTGIMVPANVVVEIVRACDDHIVVLEGPEPE